MAKTVERKEETAEPDNKDRVDVRLMSPGKYEVTPEDVFEIDIYLSRRESRWVISEKGGKNISHEKIIFRMWTYDEMIGLKKTATSYDQLRRLHMIDNDALNRLKVQKLLTAWSFGKDNPRLKIHRQNGVLTDESWGAFTKLHPSICNYIIDNMNAILEFNG